MEEVLQQLGNLVQGEARLALPLLRRVVPWGPGGPGAGLEQQLLLLVLLEQQVVEEGLLRHGPVELLQAAIGQEATQVHTVIHEETHKVWLVVDQCVHHHLLQVLGLGGGGAQARGGCG